MRPSFPRAPPRATLSGTKTLRLSRLPHEAYTPLLPFQSLRAPLCRSVEGIASRRLGCPKCRQFVSELVAVCAELV